jgi:5-methylcytosine-specific restriction endonuclease McrA
MIDKKCNICEELFPATTEYFYKHNSNKDGLFPYCKECSKKKTVQFQKKNPDKKKLYQKNYFSKPEPNKKMRERVREQREKGNYSKWQRNNPDKISIYQNMRKSKEHEISKYEWESCKLYFNNSCSYCGISEIDAKNKYKNNLHKEHVDHNGANDLSNCVPACKSCNGSKNTKELNEWYNKDNKNFNQERLNKIYNWLEKDYKLIKELILK